MHQHLVFRVPRSVFFLFFGDAGAIYLWAKLPAHAQDDEKAVEWLVKKHGVCVIPGSSCGSPGECEAFVET